MEKTGIKKGLSVGQLLFGIFFFGAGVVFIALGILENYTLSFQNILLPKWVLYAVAVIALLFGGVNIRHSFKAWKCASCGATLEYGEAFYPAKHEKDVIDAVETLDANRLQGIAPFKVGSDLIKISLDFCGKCGQNGVITLTKETRDRQKTIIKKPVMVQNAAITAFMAYVKPSSRIDPLQLDE